MASGEFSTLDMISRLDPRTLRWLDSSLAEQDFLGWSLAELREKSFLDIVQADDRKLAKQQLRTVLERGEGHGLIYRITTARGETRAVELNVGVRYGPDRRVLHLRCHLADVTAKLRDESELRRRTQELTQANDELRRTNRELEELKDRYSDLYENAPAMYFTVDRLGQFLECNDTLVRTLGYPREELLGRPVARLLPEGRTPIAGRPLRRRPRGPARSSSRASGPRPTARSSPSGSPGTAIAGRRRQGPPLPLRRPGHHRPAGPGGRAPGQERAAGPGQRRAFAEEQGTRRVHLRRLARPPGAAPDPDRLLRLPDARPGRPARRRRQGIRPLPGRGVATAPVADPGPALAFPGRQGDSRLRPG